MTNKAKIFLLCRITISQTLNHNRHLMKYQSHREGKAQNQKATKSTRDVIEGIKIGRITKKVVKAKQNKFLMNKISARFSIYMKKLQRNKKNLMILRNILQATGIQTNLRKTSKDRVFLNFNHMSQFLSVPIKHSATISWMTLKTIKTFSEKVNKSRRSTLNQLQ